MLGRAATPLLDGEVLGRIIREVPLIDSDPYIDFLAEGVAINGEVLNLVLFEVALDFRKGSQPTLAWGNVADVHSR